MIDTTAYIEWGAIQRKTGLQGSMLVRLNRDVVPIDGLDTVFVQISHTLVPYGVEKLSWKRQSAVLKLQGIDNPEVVHDLCGCAVFIPQETASQCSSQKTTDLDKILGYHVTDIQEGVLGTVRDIYAPSQQKLLVIDYQGRELLVPYHEDIVVHIDRAQQAIILQLPSGFINAVHG
mmetsp:Transcript_17116/g.39579  ORF Transcript_17116/g.39579 Transcript_17116/m.39579 type:complete len:176 (+) Transcript_17116:837-1364(+)